MMDILVLLLVMPGYKAGAKTPTTALLLILVNILILEVEDQTKAKNQTSI
jgi:hypothetical protein